MAIKHESKVSKPDRFINGSNYKISQLTVFDEGSEEQSISVGIKKEQIDKLALDLTEIIKEKVDK